MFKCSKINFCKIMLFMGLVTLLVKLWFLSSFSIKTLSLAYPNSFYQTSNESLEQNCQSKINSDEELLPYLTRNVNHGKFFYHD